MATVINTSSDADLKETGNIQDIVSEMEPTVAGAGAERQKLANAVNELERAAMEIPAAAEASKAAETEKKQSTSRIRAFVFGMVAFVELAFSDLAKKLPIISKHDVVTAYVLIDEMAALFSTNPKLAPLGGALLDAKGQHLGKVEAARFAKQRKTAAAHGYKVAKAKLKKANQEGRLFILNNAAPDSEWVARLKKPSTRKPAPKKEEPKTEPKPVAAQEQPAEQAPESKPAAETTPVAA